MGWSGVSLSMTDHTLCPWPWLTEEGFFLRPPPGWLWSNFISSLATDPYGRVFSSSSLVKVLGLSPWPNIYIDMDSLTFHPHNNDTECVDFYILFFIIQFLYFVFHYLFRGRFFFFFLKLGSSHSNLRI